MDLGKRDFLEGLLLAAALYEEEAGEEVGVAELFVDLFEDDDGGYDGDAEAVAAAA